MSETQTAPSASERLRELPRRLQRQEGFARVIASLQKGEAATLDGVWGSSCALAAAALAEHAPDVLVIVCPGTDQIDDLPDDFALFTPVPVEQFPAWESMGEDRAIHDGVRGDRTRVLKLLLGRQPPRVLVTSIQGLMQPVPERQTLAAQTRTLRTGDEVNLSELCAWLVESGFHNTSAVELPGEVSRRGGILDVFASDWFDPVRIELLGDCVESIRRFEISSQRSLQHLEEVEITVLDRGPAPSGHLADYLPPASWFFLLAPQELWHEGEQCLKRQEEPRGLHDVEAIMEQVLRFPSVTAEAVAASPSDTTCRLQAESVERFSGDLSKVREELDGAGAGQDVYVVCQTDAEVRRLADYFAGTQLAQAGRLHFPVGRLAVGFRLVPEAMVLLSSTELFHRTELRRVPQRRLGRAIDSFLELREGDLVVHVGHGIARYRGMKLLRKGGEKGDSPQTQRGTAPFFPPQAEEHLMLEFDEGVKLYVPSSKIGLVQKYVGGAKSRPRLAKLGGRTWARQKQAVEDAVSDMAADMIELQAARASRPGITFPADTEWQHEFDASFPYHETADQSITIDSIKADMTQPRPMDRLLCGDVGFGKTELAMRSAFKAVDAGYQVAVLVPTTILAEQHARTFGGRMAEFPFEIATLSRFATRKEQGEIIERLANGSIDIVIGTHRLAQPDVRFHNLGLVIIDEEQRFGVEVKERLKALRHTVDVLTMTATPIPRTLHMALLGLRDISNLQTPPEDRLAVETRVSRFDPGLIRSTILREISRNGQVFFVHNRVADIQILATRVRQIVPEARLAVAHAQMPEHELERVMLDFIDRRHNVLLTTTIVESGLDIPNANTILIDEADRYGLADLHQLRGRVGRYKHRAYCYLLVDPNKHITPNAARRLKSIEEFSDLGAGFALAMRDLEIRGAGNILGTQQSGHIALVGYELYCQLLEDAARRLKRLPPRTTIEVDIDLPGEAYIPRSYVPGMREKVDLYRRLARVADKDDLRTFVVEIQDRFGPLPAVVERLIALADVRVAAYQWLVRSIRMEDRYVVLGYASQTLVRQLAVRSGGQLRVADDHSAYLLLPQEVRTPDQILDQVKLLLQD